MAQTHSDSEGFRVLVCGSTRWKDRDFVNSMLAGFAAQFDISAVLSGPFSGADDIAKEWARERGIRYEQVNIGDSERMSLAFFDETRELPAMAVDRDPMFRNGYKKLRESAPSVVLFIPNPEGKLGATCACLQRMAKMVDIPCINGADALQDVSQRMEAAHSALTVDDKTEEPVVASGRLRR